MAVTPVLEGGIEQILTELDPDLNRSPIFMPTPDPEVHLTKFGKITWGDIFDWAKSGYDKIFYGGTPIDTVTPEMVTNAVDAGVGQTIKALGGFINQATSMTLGLASLVDATFTNIQSNMLTDFRTQSERLDKIDAWQSYVGDYVVPALDHKIAQSTATAYAFATAAQANAERNARETIFAPLYTELLKVQPAIDQSIKTNNPTILEAAQSKINALHDLLIPTLTGLAAGLGKVSTEVDECLTPMCETMGPKTDLGKLLKGLAAAATLADIAYLLSLNERELVQRITDTIAHFAGYVGTLESDFIVGGKSIGQVIAGL